MRYGRQNPPVSGACTVGKGSCGIPVSYGITPGGEVDRGEPLVFSVSKVGVSPVSKELVDISASLPSSCRVRRKIVPNTRGSRYHHRVMIRRKHKDKHRSGGCDTSLSHTRSRQSLVARCRELERPSIGKEGGFRQRKTFLRKRFEPRYQSRRIQFFTHTLLYPHPSRCRENRIWRTDPRGIGNVGN